MELTSGQGVLNTSVSKNYYKIILLAFFLLLSLSACGGSGGGGGLPGINPNTVENTTALCKDGQDNDADGQTDCADSDCTQTACSAIGTAGLDTIDAWGDYWDGIPRDLLAYTDAETTCNGLGGRLPTATELYRNKYDGLGTNPLVSDPLYGGNRTEWLWTMIGRQSGVDRALVRLSDAVVSSSVESTARQYRCIWPINPGTGFDENRCHGDPDAECYAVDKRTNIDAKDRAPLDYVGASQECAMLDASIPVVADYGPIIQSGLPNGTNQWNWTGNANYWYNGNYGVSIIKWDDTRIASWAYDNGNGLGAVSITSDSTRRFRCIGQKNQKVLAQPATPACLNGNCFTLTARQSPMTADNEDRPATTFPVAFDSCRSVGGDLPNQSEFSELVRAGWENGSNKRLWMSDSMYWYNGGYGNALGQWAGTGPANWSYRSGLGFVDTTSKLRVYRCIWRPKIGNLPTCGAGQVINESNGSYTCAASTDGDSMGLANPGTAVKDAWGNEWDLNQRSALAYTDAKSSCESIGARLPTANELWGVRSSTPYGFSVGDDTNTSYLWTSLPYEGIGNKIIFRIGDNNVNTDNLVAWSAGTTLRPYRCIWPSSKGNVLSGRACYGDPAAPCFQISYEMIADSEDRVAVSAHAAIAECKAAGGKIPDLREFSALTHAGWEKGSDAWLWINESVIWTSVRFIFNIPIPTYYYGYSLSKWSGIGTPAWSFQSPLSGAVSQDQTYRNFRCVYSTVER